MEKTLNRTTFTFGRIMKKCSKCKEKKPLSDFNKNKSGKYGVHHYCRICNSLQKKKSYNRERIKITTLKTLYGLTLDNLHQMYKDQDGICKKPYSKVSAYGGLHIDHCHLTNKVRGLLCIKCNNLLGQANDDINILQLAIEYLKQKPLG